MDAKPVVILLLAVGAVALGLNLIAQIPMPI